MKMFLKVNEGPLRNCYVIMEYFDDGSSLVLDSTSILDNRKLNKSAPLKLYRHNFIDRSFLVETNAGEEVIIGLIYSHLENFHDVNDLDFKVMSTNDLNYDILTSGKQVFIFEEVEEFKRKRNKDKDLIKNLNRENNILDNDLRSLRDEAEENNKEIKDLKTNLDDKDFLINELREETLNLKQDQKKELSEMLNDVSYSMFEYEEEIELMRKNRIEEISKLLKTYKRDELSSELIDLKLEVIELKTQLSNLKNMQNDLFRKSQQSDYDKYLENTVEKLTKDNEKLKFKSDMIEALLKAMEEERKIEKSKVDELIKGMNRLTRENKKLEPMNDYEKMKYHLDFDIPKSVPNNPVIYLLYGTKSNILKVGRAKNSTDRLKLYSRGGVLKNDTHFESGETVSLLFLSNSFIDNNDKYFYHEKIYKELMDKLVKENKMSKLDVGVEWYQLEDEDYLNTIIEELKHLSKRENRIIEKGDLFYKMKNNEEFSFSRPKWMS